MILRFTGLQDNRSDWYSIEQVGIKVTVDSRTYIEVKERFFDLNSTIELTIRNERGESIPDAPLRLEIGYSLTTYLTGPDGNVTVDLGNISPGDSLTSLFQEIREDHFSPRT